jgi:hypothetical protein
MIIPTYLGKANEIVLKLISFNYKPSSEFDYLNYKEGKGAFIRYGNTTQKYTIYDKMGEIFSKGYTKTDQNIIQATNFKNKSRQVLKSELSYLRKDSFEKAIRTRLPYKKKDYYLEDILKISLSRDILLKAFEEVFNSVAVGLISLSEMQENELLAYLENSRLTPASQHELFYWVRIATKNGTAGTWKEIERKYKGGSVPRKKKEIALILTELGEINSNIPNLIDFIREKHERFNIIKPRNIT